DAQAVERLDADLPSLDVDEVADFGAAAEATEDVAADRRVGRLVDMQRELRVDVGDERQPLHLARPLRTPPHSPPHTPFISARAPDAPGPSPTRRPISDSKVTRRAVPPYSSITSASRARRRRISVSRSSAVSVSGTVATSRTSEPAVAASCPSTIAFITSV